MNPNMEIKKPLRARKTMAPRCRKPVEMWDKMKTAQTAEKTANGASSEDNHVHLKMVETNCLYPSSLEQLDCRPESKPAQLPLGTLNKPLANLVLNSEISIYNDRQEISKDHPCNPCATDSDMKQIWNAGALQDILYSWYEKESNCPIVKPVEVHLNLDPNSQHLRNSKEQFSLTSPTNAIPALDGGVETAEETLVHQIIPVLEREGGNIQLHKKMVNSSVQTDDSPRKRRVSESSEDALSKRIKSGKECDSNLDKRQSGLEKVKSFIQNQTDTLMGKLDHQLQHLHERIDRTQCLRKHEGIAIKIVKRISRLDRRIDAVVSFQKAGLSKKVNRPGADSQNKILNSAARLPGNAHVKATPSHTREALSKSTEKSDDTVCIDLVNKNSGVEAVNATDVQQKGSSVKTNTPAETPRNTKNVFLIDLTDEESDVNKVDGERERKIVERRHLAPEDPIPKPPQSTLQLLSKEVLVEFSHLPPLPRVHSQPEYMNGFQNTLPPQKLELAVAQVQNPKGIALQWNITNVDPRCAPIDSFHLFMCVEGPGGGVPSDWMKTNKIQALPLPMACSLSQLLGSARCYFTMQSKDIYGRYGPFCDIQSICAL